MAAGIRSRLTRAGAVCDIVQNAGMLTVLDRAIYGAFAPDDDHYLIGASIPWRHVDMCLCWNGGEEMPADQAQGDAALRHRAGWTCLAWWDRSVDPRRGSNTALFIRGIHDFQAMLGFLEQYYPCVAQRQPGALVLKMVESSPSE